MKKLGVKPKEVFRKTDAANRELKLTGNEPEDVLIEQMARHPTLLQRPIGVAGQKAALGRPPEKLLVLAKR